MTVRLTGSSSLLPVSPVLKPFKTLIHRSARTPHSHACLCSIFFFLFLSFPSTLPQPSQPQCLDSRGWWSYHRGCRSGGNAWPTPRACCTLHPSKPRCTAPCFRLRTRTNLDIRKHIELSYNFTRLLSLSLTHCPLYIKVNIIHYPPCSVQKSLFANGYFYELNVIVCTVWLRIFREKVGKGHRHTCVSCSLQRVNKSAPSL